MSPREALEAARAEAAALVQAGEPLEPLLRRLAERDRVALAEVVVGPRAPGSAALVRAALLVLPALEEAIAPKALYQRLVAHSTETAAEVLAAAIGRHPVASWVLRLSVAVEGPRAGLDHLQATQGLSSFPRVCQLYAEAGHDEGLIAAAALLARPELAAALAAAGRLEPAARAIVGTLAAVPDSPVLAFAAAGWGPDLEPLLLACVRNLRDARTADALAPWLRSFPRARALLLAVRPALPASG